MQTACQDSYLYYCESLDITDIRRSRRIGRLGVDYAKLHHNKVNVKSNVDSFDSFSTMLFLGANRDDRSWSRDSSKNVAAA